MDNKKQESNDQKIFQSNNIKEKNIEEKKENINDLVFFQNKKIEDLQIALLKKEKKINDLELRKLANIENIKKHTEDKIKKIKSVNLEQCLKKIMPIIDSLEDILIFSNTLKIKETPLIEGIELTLQTLLKILFKLGVKVEGKKNELFNSNIHTPILIESDEKKSPNHIISIIKKGFTFNKILLRKAVVTIPKS